MVKHHTDQKQGCQPGTKVDTLLTNGCHHDTDSVTKHPVLSEALGHGRVAPSLKGNERRCREYSISLAMSWEVNKLMAFARANAVAKIVSEC